jgi:DNA-binding CsgD family transcriptional regulator/tetratricopeptide (TPR) repeat protein
MDTLHALTGGRRAYEALTWPNAVAQLSLADGLSPLEPEDLERLAVARYMIGRDEESQETWERAHHAWVRCGDPARAARCAFWLAFGFVLAGEAAQCNGWLARARRLLDGGDLDCVERGYVLVPAALQTMFGGDPAGAHASFREAKDIGERFGDPDLTAVSTLSLGQALVRLGRLDDGVAAFDDVMVTVMAGELSPVMAGVLYCAVLLECRSIFDVRRAREWTLALSRWCERHQELAPYRGQCQVHRSEIMQLQGEWSHALREAHEACQRLSGRPAAGLAFYQLAELHRLRGESEPAEHAYRQASRWGRQPQPGLALLRLAGGHLEAATTGIGRALAEAHDPIGRSHLLGAYVEIMLAVGDVPAARTAAEELASVAAELDAPVLHAESAYARGAVRLAGTDARAALAELRRAWTIWQDLDAPYGAARARCLIGLACRQLGDEDSASMELDAAAWIFCQLGAEPDLARVERLAGEPAPRPAGDLTVREREVLALVAAGRTNRLIATELLISEHTVRRHLQNIFTKLDVPSRAAATAHALRHNLI